VHYIRLWNRTHLKIGPFRINSAKLLCKREHFEITVLERYLLTFRIFVQLIQEIEKNEDTWNNNVLLVIQYHRDPLRYYLKK